MGGSSQPVNPEDTNPIKALMENLRYQGCGDNMQVHFLLMIEMNVTVIIVNNTGVFENVLVNNKENQYIILTNGFDCFFSYR